MADSAGDKLVFFKLFVPKKEVYVGEILGVEFQVYVRAWRMVIRSCNTSTSSAVAR